MAFGDILCTFNELFVLSKKQLPHDDALAIKDNQPFIQVKGLVVGVESFQTPKPIDNNISHSDPPLKFVEDQGANLDHLLHDNRQADATVSTHENHVAPVENII